MKLLVLGIGSPFQDDQLGWAVIQKLQQSKQLQGYSSEQLQLMAVDRPGLLLLDLFKQAQTVFLIDAVKINGTIGQLHCLQVEAFEKLNWQRELSSSHSIGVAEAIQIGRSLDLLPPQLRLYGIEIGEVSPQHFELSAVLVDSVERLALQIERDIRLLIL